MTHPGVVLGMNHHSLRKTFCRAFDLRFRGVHATPQNIQALVVAANTLWEDWASRICHQGKSWQIVAFHNGSTISRILHSKPPIDPTAILPNVPQGQVGLMGLHNVFGVLRTIEELDAIARRYGASRFFPYCGHTECIDDPAFGEACLDDALKSCKECERRREGFARVDEYWHYWHRCRDCQKRLGVFSLPTYRTTP